MKLFLSGMINTMIGGRTSKLPLYSRRGRTKYSRPHQGAHEIARRKRQIERGILKVSC